MYTNLFIARRERSESQADVAKILLISSQSYYLKEKGKSPFTLEQALILSKHYKQTVEHLFDSKCSDKEDSGESRQTTIES